VPALPDVPTLAEGTLPKFNAISWLGLLAPAGMPKEMVDKIAADVRAVLADEAVKAKFVSLGGVPRATTPQEFVKLIADDRQRYAQIIRDKKISTE
jgi:tripartite-type tricarboxylate transporter receptor subunit TctC